MKKWMFLLLPGYLVSGCSGVTDEWNGEISTPKDDFVSVSTQSWGESHRQAYAFKIDGDIACSQNEVYFYPLDTSYDDSMIGWPLNTKASDYLKTHELEPSVENFIRQGANLSEAVQDGLNICASNT